MRFDLSKKRFNSSFNPIYWRKSYSPDYYEFHVGLLVRSKAIGLSCNFIETDKKINFLRQVGVSLIRNKTLGGCSDVEIHREFMNWYNKSFDYVVGNARSYLHERRDRMPAFFTQEEMDLDYPGGHMLGSRDFRDGRIIYVREGRNS
jgi:hypothetical protein